MNYKFQHRQKGNIIYFSKMGKDAFTKSSDSENYKFIGPISEEDQAKEEAASAKEVKHKMSDEDEKASYNEAINKKVVAKVKHLSKAELDEKLAGKKTELEEEELAELEEDEEDMDEEARLENDIKDLETNKTTENVKTKAAKGK